MRGFRQLLTVALIAVATAVPACAQDAPTPPAQRWSFDGPFGGFDLAAANGVSGVFRGLRSLPRDVTLHYRDLAGVGLNEDQIKGIAAAVTVPLGLNDQGEPKEGPERLPVSSGHPPNEQANRAAHNGALPPDLSLIVNAREGHADYIYALLTGFADAPPGMQMQDGMSYNKYFAGHQIGMPPPLQDGRVTYADGTPAAGKDGDVVTFLTWAANPEMVERKQIGWRWVLFFLIMTGLTYAVKRKVWSDVH